jgi:hypothetical protein
LTLLITPIPENNRQHRHHDHHPDCSAQIDCHNNNESIKKGNQVETFPVVLDDSGSLDCTSGL